jgi:MinD-like ATPase involved in chromosome partitioning or flagellar assembly
LEGFQKLIEALNLDYLFIDTHPGLNEETLLSISVSDILVLILRPDQQDFMGTAVTAEVARKLKIPKTLLMINMASPSLDFEALGKEVEKSYNMTVAGIVPFSEDVIQQSNAIFCLRYPEHPISREIEKVAQQIMG